MYEGLLIEYRISVPLFGKQKWLTEIRHIRPGRSFVDEQRIGPYRLWYHYHEVQPGRRGGSVMTDNVTYIMPFSPAGDLVHRIIVRRQLEQIFDFRKSALEKIF